MIRNNFVAAADPDLLASDSGFDAGIAVEQARFVRVVHNTVASTAAPFSSIEWRWQNTQAGVTNNLVSHMLRSRDGAQASLAGNIQDAPTAWFRSVAEADLHLRTGSLPDGSILYCHDTDDPLVFNPATGDKRVVTGSGTAQGCHATTVLLDGRVLFVGGQEGEDPGSFRNGVRWVKAYDPLADRWQRLPDLGEARWYPTLTRLPGGRVLVTGGGQPPDARRQSRRGLAVGAR